MTVTLNEQEVFEALKSVFGYPAHSTLKVTVGRGANPTNFVIDIPAFTQTQETEVNSAIQPAIVQPCLFDKEQ